MGSVPDAFAIPVRTLQPALHLRDLVAVGDGGGLGAFQPLARPLIAASSFFVDASVSSAASRVSPMAASSALSRVSSAAKRLSTSRNCPSSRSNEASMVSNAPFERATSAPMAPSCSPRFAALPPSSFRLPFVASAAASRCRSVRRALQAARPLRQPPVQQRQMGLQLLKARFQRRLLCGPGFPRLRARFQRVQPRLHALQLLVHGVQPRLHGGLQRADFR